MRFDFGLPCQAGRFQKAATTALVIYPIRRFHLLEHFPWPCVSHLPKNIMVNINAVEEMVPADRLVPLRHIRPGLVCHDCEFAIPTASWRDREPQSQIRILEDPLSFQMSRKSWKLKSSSRQSFCLLNPEV